MSPALKIGIRIAVITSVAIILFQLSGIMIVYKYFKPDYYITATALIFLAGGILIARYDRKTRSLNKSDLLQQLTAKEMQILQLIAEGKSNKEIAADNFVELSTIKTHINNIYGKLDVSKRMDAARIYRSVK